MGKRLKLHRWSDSIHPISSSISLLLFFVTPFLCKAQKSEFSYQNTPLEQVLKEWNNALNLHFSYDDDEIKKYSVSQSFSKLSKEEMLLKLLREFPLSYKLLSKQSAVIRKCKSDFYLKKSAQLHGQVFDKDTRQALPFVNVLIKNSSVGASTDENGYFTLSIPLVSDDSIQLSFVGYKSIMRPAEQFKKRSFSPIYMSIQANRMQTVLVEGNRWEEGNMIAALNSKGPAHEFNISQQEDLGGLAEKDFLQYIQLIPGVNGTDESASKIHIRGGGSGQNMVLFDHIPMYHFGHFFGKIASINSNIVDKVTVEKEGYDAQYGGRVSGVINIEAINRIPDTAYLQFEGSLLSGNVNLSLPFSRQKAALFVSYRRAFTDFYHSLPFQAYFDQTFQNSRIAEDSAHVRLNDLDTISSLTPRTSFKDLNAKFVWQPDSVNHCALSFIKTLDVLNYEYIEGDYFHERDKLDVANLGLSLNWNHKWDARLSSSATIAWSQYENHYYYVDDIAIPRDSSEFVDDNFNLLNDFSFQWSNRFRRNYDQVTFGYSLNAIQETIDNFAKNPGWKSNYHFRDDTMAINQTVFFNYRADLHSKLSLRCGARISYYNLTHSYYPEPRFTLIYRPVDALRIMLSSGLYYQAINQIVNRNNLNAEAHTWILSRSVGYDSLAIFPIVENKQSSLGMAYRYKGWTLESSIFHKRFSGISTHIIHLDNSDFPDDIIGDMKSLGFEASIQSSGRWYYTLASYSYSKVFFTFEYPTYPVPAPYDQRHNFSFLQGFKYRGFHLSALWKLGSGRPYTLLDSVDKNGIIYGDYNKGRLAPYQRLDLSFSWTYIRNNTRFKITLSALNTFNRKNYLQRFYTARWESNDPDEIPRVIRTDRQGLPFTPNIGIMMRKDL